jgi:hypothetical protein
LGNEINADDGHDDDAGKIKLEFSDALRVFDIMPNLLSSDVRG